jgi:hypothetical protein
VHSHNLVPHLFVHVDKSLVPEDTGISHENVNGTEGIDCSLDDSVTILGRADSRNCLTTD